MGWFTSRPDYGQTSTFAHWFGRSRRVPVCVDDDAHDPGGTVMLTAAESAPRCPSCVAAVADAGGREQRA